MLLESAGAVFPRNGGCARTSRASGRQSLLPEALRGQEKLYALCTVGRHCWVPPFDLPDPLPAVLEPQWRRAFQVPMCAEPADRGLELVVQVIVEKKESLPDIGLSFNGCWPHFDGHATEELLFPKGRHGRHAPEHEARNHLFAVAEIEEGWNELVVVNGGTETPVNIVGVELAVKETE